MNELVMGQDLAVDSASIDIAAAGAHAERLSNLVRLGALPNQSVRESL